MFSQLGFISLLGCLLLAHILADYASYSELCRFSSLPSTRHNSGLLAHVLVHGGLVAIVTGSLILGSVEALIHGMVDEDERIEIIDFKTGQMIHVYCKALWAAATPYFL